MKRKLLLIVVLVAASVSSYSQLLLQSASDESPVVDAFLLDESGVLVGLTGADGAIPENVLLNKSLYAKHFLGVDAKLADKGQENNSVKMSDLNWNVKVKNVRTKEKTHMRLHTVYRIYEFINEKLCYIKDGEADYVFPVNGGKKAKKRVKELRILSSSDANDTYDDLTELPNISSSLLYLNNNTTTDGEKSEANGYSRTLQLNGSLRYVSTNSTFLPLNTNFFGARVSVQNATTATYYDYDTHILKALHQTAEVKTSIKKQDRRYVIIKDVYVVEAEYLTKKEAKAATKLGRQSADTNLLAQLADAENNNIGLRAACNKLVERIPTEKDKRAIE